MTSNLSDVYILWEGGPPGQVLLIDQLHQGLSRFVDHSVGHNSSLSKGGSKGQAWENVPVQRSGEFFVMNSLSIYLVTRTIDHVTCCWLIVN